MEYLYGQGGVEEHGLVLLILQMKTLYLADLDLHTLALVLQILDI